jgi:hypothetical protein
MCTVTFIARKRGYALGMNRDERLTRVQGLPPAERRSEGRRVICPSEPGGGTWIALNETGVTFALINWYSIPTRVNGAATTRGEIVVAVSGFADESSAAVRLQEFQLKRINPFRLIGIFPATQQVVEWRWDLSRLTTARHRWKTQQWISSGFDEPTAQRVRSKTFQQAGRQLSVGSLDWLRRLHCSHSPHAGPFSTCMHRADAATVSYTEISVSFHEAVMHSELGAPCQSYAPINHRLQLGNYPPADPRSQKSPFQKWWRRGELNPRPKSTNQPRLHA